MNNRICIYTPPFNDIKSYFEVVDVASEYGISNVETINFFELAVPDIEFAKKLREYADSKNIKFTCVSVGINLVQDDWQEKIEITKKYADIAAILGSPYLHHTIALEFKNPEVVKKNYDLYYERGILAVREIYDYAQTIGVRTAYEDQGYLFNGVNTFERFITEVGRDVGVVADFGNIMFVEEKIKDFIPRFSDKIVNVHLKDYIFTKKNTREKAKNEFFTYYGNYLQDCILGEGAVNIKAAFACLEAINYSGYIAIECVPLGDEKDSFEHNLKYIDNYFKKGEKN